MLSNRKFITQIEGNASSLEFCISDGLQQGTVNAPIYLIYIPPTSLSYITSIKIMSSELARMQTIWLYTWKGKSHYKFKLISKLFFFFFFFFWLGGNPHGYPAPAGAGGGYVGLEPTKTTKVIVLGGRSCVPEGEDLCESMRVIRSLAPPSGAADLQLL